MKTDCFSQVVDASGAREVKLGWKRGGMEFFFGVGKSRDPVTA